MGRRAATMSLQIGSAYYYGKQMDHAHQQLNSALPVHCRAIRNARTLVTHSNYYYISSMYKSVADIT